MSRLGRVPCDDAIPFGNDVIGGDSEISQQTVDGLQGPLDAFWPRSLVSTRIMVHEVGSNKLINDLWILLVQYLVDETANERLVLFQHGVCST